MRAHKPTRVMDYGMEAQCNRCHEWWPADTEFFPVVSNGRAQGSCWACRREREAERSQQRLAA